MSEKKNDPVSILGKNKPLTKTIEYRVEGVLYRETIDLDTANGNFGKSLGIEISGSILGPENAYWVKVKSKKVLEKLQKDSNRMNAYGIFLKEELLPRDGAEQAFDASGMKELAYGDKSWSNIPLPGTGGEDDNPEEEDNDTKIEPSDIFGGYTDIFKEHLKYPIDMFIGRGFSVTGGPTTGDNPFVEGTGEGSQDYMFIEQFMYKPPQPSVGRYK